MSNYSELNEILNNFFTPNYHWRTTIQSTEKDEVYEVNYTKDGAYLLFEVPGFNKSHLNVEMENDTLYIEGKRTYKLNGEEKFKTVKKQFKIGKEYDASQVEATVEDGLLTVYVPNFKKQDKKRISLL